MKLFSEKVQPTLTSSTHNILQVEDYNEIFFGVYEIEINKTKYPVEKISEHNGNPVVSVPVSIKGVKSYYPFVLSKGKLEVLFNENNIDASLNKEPLLIDVDDEPISEKIEYPKEFEEEIPYVEVLEKNKEIFEQIEKAKKDAIYLASKIKKQKLQEANKEIASKKKALESMISDERANLIKDFIDISNKIKSELIGKNDNRLNEISLIIDNKIENLSNSLHESIKNDLDSSSVELESKVKELVEEIRKSLQPKINEELENITLEIGEKVDSIEKNLEEKLSEKADITLIEDVESELGSVTKANIELNDKINKGVNKALSRVGVVDKKINELAVTLTEEVENKISNAEESIIKYYTEKLKILEEKTFDITEETRKYIIELVTESRNNLISEIRQIKNEKPIEYIVEAKGKSSTIKLDNIIKDFDKKINSKIDTEVTRLRKYIDIYSGGGSVAVNFADDGIMNGDLTVNGNVSVSQNVISSEMITNRLSFNTTTNLPVSAGQLTWDDADGTLRLGLKGGNVSLQLGQEDIIRVVNKTNANLLESQYKVVRVRTRTEGGAQGQRLAVVLAKADNEIDSATTLGVVTENIAKNEEGFITTFGLVGRINTTGSLQGETWEEGDMLYLSPTVLGNLTKVKPVAPQHTVVIGYVVYVNQNEGKIFVKVDNGYELDELHNVRITNIQNNDALIYNSLSSVWENKPIPNPDLSQYLPLSGGTVTGNLTVVGTLSTTLLEALSANVTVLDIKQYELSGFNVTGNATVQGSISASGPVYGDVIYMDNQRVSTENFCIAMAIALG